MRPTVLAYGYDSKEIKILKTACARLDLRLRRVEEPEYHQPIGAFFGLAPRKEDGPQDAGPVPGRMLVLAGLTSRQLDGLLSALKTARAGDSLKAVLTEHNTQWTGPALYGELVREKAEIEGR